jgi:hypothetical protein
MRGHVGCPMAGKKGGNFTCDAQRKLETSNFSETVIKVAEYFLSYLACNIGGIFYKLINTTFMFLLKEMMKEPL